MMIDQIKVRVLLVESIHSDAVFRLEAEGYHVECVPGALDEAGLIERIPGVHLLGVRSRTQVTAGVLDAADSLVAVGAFCIGTDQIDLAATARAGVTVFNAPFCNTRSVAELAIAEIIMMTRRLAEKNALMHAGVWDKCAEGAHEIRGRRLGIVGYGNIGTQLSVIAENLGMHVSYYDTADKLALSNARRCATLDELLETSDFVTLHVDGRASNAAFFGAEQFKRMRPGSLFLNLSRGICVDHLALRDALTSGHLAGAAVDVFPQEPHGRGDEFRSELRGLPNVILTPHIGGSTEEAQSTIGTFVATKFVNFINEGDTSLCVSATLPSLSRERREHRTLQGHHAS
jgi:D-3-phosphoglycerate dehydrogenase